MEENKNTKVIDAEQGENTAIVKEGAVDFVKKAGKWIKDNGLKVLAVGAVGVISFLAGAHVAGKSDHCCNDDCDDDTIEVDSYVIDDEAEEE